MIIPRAMAILAMILAGAPGVRAASERLALFDVEFINTSPQPTTPEETARLRMVRDLAAEELARHGYTLVDTAPAAAEVAKVSSLRGCNGCELDLAKALGADLAALGWVQKVSNLILNINLQIRDVRDGRLLRAASADIRGNSDETWRHGIRYLLREQLFRGEPAAGATGAGGNG